MIVFGPMAGGQAADAKSNKPLSASQAPIVVEADELYFSDSSGELFAKGNVQVVQNGDKVQATTLRGNTKQNELWTEGTALLTRPGISVSGADLRYNLSTHSGFMNTAKGKVDKLYIASSEIATSPEKTTITAGSVTGCPAEVPDYHISADKVEIWPGDKMIAYNAKFWIKGKVLYSLPKYQSSLARGESGFTFPKPTYSSENGIGIAQYLEVPFAPRLAIHTNLAYHSKAGFKPNYGLISRGTGYTAKVSYGNEENADHEWIKKEPEYSIAFKPRRLGDTALTLTTSATYGKWVEGTTSGWRQGYQAYLSHDPIAIGSKAALNLGTGYEKIIYGYNDSKNDVFRIDSQFTLKPNSRLDTWIGYSYRSVAGVSPYEFDQIDIAHEGNIGFMYKLDPLNGLGVNMIMDVKLGNVTDVDYTWKRNLHCLEADITYRAKRDQLRMKVSVVEW